MYYGFKVVNLQFGLNISFTVKSDIPISAKL